MGSTFLSLPAKRSIQYTTAAGMPELTTTTGAGSSNKRFKAPPEKLLSVPPGHITFRLLCHSSRIGGVIGKSGSIIKQLQQVTGTKIRIEEAPADCPDRVISIIAQTATSRICLGGVGGQEEIEVSKGQEALLRVFERILEVAAESDGAGVMAAGGVVSCRMLAEASHVGSVIGKGGKIVEKIRRDCGVKIRILIDNLPACASSTEEVVEIEGDVFAIKKALVAVSQRLQDCQQVDKTKTTGSKPAEAVHHEYVPEVPADILWRHSSIVPTLPSTSIGYDSRPPLSVEFNSVPIVDTKAPQQEITFRILCSNDSIGGIIGKAGNIIRALQNETGASIAVGAASAECDERLITVSALENPESRYSAAQKTVVLVFSRSVDCANEKKTDSGLNKGTSVVARLVVAPNQVGCLLGKGGAIVSEMRRVTGASIKILGADQVPKCVPQNDQLIQISGELMKVKDAIYHVTGRLRDNLFSNVLSNSTRSIGTTSVLSNTNTYGGVGDLLRDPHRDALRDPVGDVLRDPVGGASRDLVAGALGDPIGDALRDPIRDTLRDPIRDAWRDPIRDTLREPLEPLRDSLRDSLRDPIPVNFHSPVGISSSLNRHSTFTQGMDSLGFPSGLDRYSPPRLWSSQASTGLNPRGNTDISRLSTLKGGLELGSVNKSVIVTNTTVEIIIPEHVYSSVYGENGKNLARLRQISGAKVILHEPRLGTNERIVVISGTPDETQAAQSLLQAFILTGQP